MSLFTALVTSKIAAGMLAGGTLAAGGTAAAAYTGTLPASLQHSAHDIIGAPAVAATSKAAQHVPETGSQGKASRPADAPDPGDPAKAQDSTGTDSTGTDSTGTDSTGPDAAGPAAFGLCTAFANGGLDPSSTAYKSLAVASGGSADIGAYCKAVPVPGESAGHRSETQGNGNEAPGKPGDAGATHQAKPPAQAGKGLSRKPVSAGKS
jgi:hypothetical protein